MKHKVEFRQFYEDETSDGEFRVLIDGQEIIPFTNDLDMAWSGFDVLWKALGIEVTFTDYEGKPYPAL